MSGSAKLSEVAMIGDLLAARLHTDADSRLINASVSAGFVIIDEASRTFDRTNVSCLSLSTSSLSRWCSQRVRRLRPQRRKELVRLRLHSTDYGSSTPATILVGLRLDMTTPGGKRSVRINLGENRVMRTIPVLRGIADGSRSACTQARRSSAILIPNADDEYELYWNGRKIGNYGTPPPHAWWYHRPRAASFPLPRPPYSSLEGVLALRVWERPFDTSSPDTSGGLSAPPVIGDARALSLRVDAAQAALVQENLPNLLIGAIMIATGLLALVFYARGRNDKVYLWCGLYLLGVGSSIWLTFTEPWKVYQFFGSVEQILRDVPLWLLLLGLFDLEKEVGWRKWTLRLVTAYVAAQVIDIGLLMLWDRAGPGFMWVDATDDLHLHDCGVVSSRSPIRAAGSQTTHSEPSGCAARSLLHLVLCGH